MTQTQIDDNVRRILRTIIRVGLLDGPMRPDHGVVGSAPHTQLAYKVAAEGIVLLKDSQNILPLDAAKIHSLALIGHAKDWQMGAYGSPGVDAINSVMPFDAIQQRAGDTMKVSFDPGTNSSELLPATVVTPAQGASGQQGWTGEYFGNQNLQGTPALTRLDPSINFNWPTAGPGNGIAQTHFSARWTGNLVAPQSGTYTFQIRADDGVRMFIDGKTVIDSWVQSDNGERDAEFDMTAGQSYKVSIEYFQQEGGASITVNWIPPGSTYTDAVNAAKASDVAIVFVTANHEGEGQDRPSMDLSDDQDGLIEAVAAANPNTIVVLNNGTPVRMVKWIDKVRGVIEVWFPGEEGGLALSDILFGDVNPSGKLPDTLGVNREDYPDYGNFPGVNNNVNYAEGIYVGYRHFDKARIEPQFPFGFGLSYSTFRFSALKLSSASMSASRRVSASVDITNTSKCEGEEVVELYVHDPSPKIDKPVRELKGFMKIDLMPGETKNVSIPLNAQSLAYCDVPGAQWKADKGIYDIETGSSSRDIRLSAPLRLTSTYTLPILDLRSSGE